jgi:hypothetical protein
VPVVVLPKLQSVLPGALLKTALLCWAPAEATATTITALISTMYHLPSHCCMCHSANKLFHFISFSFYSRVRGWGQQEGCLPPQPLLCLIRYVLYICEHFASFVRELLVNIVSEQTTRTVKGPVHSTAAGHCVPYYSLQPPNPPSLRNGTTTLFKRPSGAKISIQKGNPQRYVYFEAGNMCEMSPAFHRPTI